MTPNEYQQAALRTEKTPDCVNVNRARFYADPLLHYTPEAHQAAADDKRLGRLLHAALGACTETGELQDMIKKHLIYGKPLDLVNVIEEVGDTLWYLALALAAASFTMEDAMLRNITKLRLRYPDKFTEELALNRDLDAERTALEGSSDIADENTITRR